MSILPDWRIRQLAQAGMIAPFEERLIRTSENAGVISYGLSSFGYDLRCADEWKVFTNVMSAIVDPKHFDERSFVDIQANEIIIPPNSFVLARSLEYMKIPDNVMVVALGEIDVCTLRHRRKRHAFRTRLGRPCHAGIL